VPEETSVPDPEATFAEAPREETTAYDDLIFGETRISTVEDAAVRAVVVETPAAGPPMINGLPPAPAPAPAPAAALGDHDGETISAERLAALQAQRGLQSPSNSTPPAPPHPGATLVVSTGERLRLDRTAVIGRRPRAVRATGVIPHLVTVPSPAQDISRSHVELRVEGRDVIAVDLDTMNGTKLLRPGAEPVRLHPSEPTLLVSGDRLDLGDGIVLEFEGI